MNKDTLQQDIIQELGLGDLPEDRKVKLLAVMTESVLKRIAVEVFERLSKEEKAEFDKLREEGDFDKIQQFLKEKITDYDQMVERIIQEFKEEMKKTVADLNKALGEK